MPSAGEPVTASSAWTRAAGIPPLPLLRSLQTPEEHFAFLQGSALVAITGAHLRRAVFWETFKRAQKDNGAELIAGANEALEGLVLFLPPGEHAVRTCALYARPNLLKVVDRGVEGALKTEKYYAELAENFVDRVLTTSPDNPSAPFITEA